MKIDPRSIEELKTIVEKDYGVLLTDEEAGACGVSLLRLSRLGVTALARADEQRALAFSGKGEIS